MIFTQSPAHSHSASTYQGTPTKCLTTQPMSLLLGAVGSRDAITPLIRHRSSHARKKHANHVKRPLNAFFLFRKHVCENSIVKKLFVIEDQRTISRVVAEMWKKLRFEGKEQWHEMFRKEKESFLKVHPEYKYRPDISRRRKKTRQLRKEQQTKQDCISMAETILQRSDGIHHSEENSVLEPKVSQTTVGRMNFCENTYAKGEHFIAERTLLEMEHHVGILPVQPSEIYQMPLCLSEADITSQEEQLYPTLWKEPIHENMFELVNGTASETSDPSFRQIAFNRYMDGTLGPGGNDCGDNDHWITESVLIRNFL